MKPIIRGCVLSDHGSLTGLLDDDHTQYPLLLGRAGGQTLIGGTATGETLTLQSTSHATKGKILFGNSAYDEVNNRLGIGKNNPDAKIEISGSGLGTTGKTLQIRGDDIYTAYDTYFNGFGALYTGRWVVISGDVSGGGPTRASNIESMLSVVTDVVGPAIEIRPEAGGSWPLGVVPRGSVSDFIFNIEDTGELSWSNTTHALRDVGLKRTAAGRLGITNGSTGTGTMTLGGLAIGKSSNDVTLDVLRTLTNDTSGVITKFGGGTDVTLGPTIFQFGVHTSSAGASRYGYMMVGDDGNIRPLILNHNGASLFGNVGIGISAPTSRIHGVDTVNAGSGSLAAPILELAQTWNTSGTPTGIRFTVTDTASNAASLLMDLKVATASKASISKAGAATFAGGFGCNGAAAQAAYASGGALATYGTGAYGFDSDANASALHAMVVKLRACLVAAGLMS